jgi:hypothetical protein
VLNYVYDEIYAEYVAKNPLFAPGEPFRWVPVGGVVLCVCVWGGGVNALLRRSAPRRCALLHSCLCYCPTDRPASIPPPARRSIEPFNNALNGYLRSKGLLQSI